MAIEVPVKPLENQKRKGPLEMSNHSSSPRRAAKRHQKKKPHAQRRSMDDQDSLLEEDSPREVEWIIQS